MVDSRSESEPTGFDSDERAQKLPLSFEHVRKMYNHTPARGTMNISRPC